MVPKSTIQFHINYQILHGVGKLLCLQVMPKFFIWMIWRYAIASEITQDNQADAAALTTREEFDGSGSNQFFSKYQAIATPSPLPPHSTDQSHAPQSEVEAYLEPPQACPWFCWVAAEPSESRGLAKYLCQKVFPLFYQASPMSQGISLTMYCCFFVFDFDEFYTFRHLSKRGRVNRLRCDLIKSFWLK